MHRSGLLGAVRMVKLPSDKDFSLRGETLREAIEKDKADGYIPFFVSIARAKRTYISYYIVYTAVMFSFSELFFP